MNRLQFSEPGVNVFVLVKGVERYVFMYDDAHRQDVLQAAGRAASNPELSFSWYDAAKLSQSVRESGE